MGTQNRTGNIGVGKEAAKKKLLVAKELFSDPQGLSSRIQWQNDIRKYVVESPGFLPYVRSWFQGRALAEIIRTYPLQNVVGIVSSDSDVLSRIINHVRESVPHFDPFAVVDPLSESIYRRTDKRDQNPLADNESMPADIRTLITNRTRRLKNRDLGEGKDWYANVLALLYNTPDGGIGWMDTEIRKHIAAGAKMAVPTLPCIVNEESKTYWKNAFVALKNYYIKTEDIDDKSGIPLALHIPINHEMFREGASGIIDEIYNDVEELNPSAITIKVTGGARLDKKDDIEKRKRISDFIENIGRTAKAQGTFTHLFSENTSGIHAFNLGINTFSN